MNKLLTVVALVTLVTSPVHAANSVSHRHVLPPADAQYENGYSARAQWPAVAPNEYWHDRAKGSPG